MNDRVGRVPIDNVDARIAEIDENFVRLELTVLERSEQLYEARHPETRHGVAGGKASGATRRADRTNANSAPVPSSFSRDTAAKTGRSERSVQEDTRIAERVTPAVGETADQAVMMTV